MNEEEAESAEIVPGKPLGRFDLPGRVRKAPLFPLHPEPENLALYTSACSAASAVKFFLSPSAQFPPRQPVSRPI